MDQRLQRKSVKLDSLIYVLFKSQRGVAIWRIIRYFHNLTNQSAFESKVLDLDSIICVLFKPQSAVS